MRGRSWVRDMGELARRGFLSLGAGRAWEVPAMKLCIFTGINVGGYIGWSLAEPCGMLTAFLVSGVGSVLGVYAGWWLARRYLT